MEHEVVREAVEVSLNGLVQNFGLNAVKFGEIGIQQNLFMAEDMDERRDLLRNEKARVFLGRSFLFGGYSRNWSWKELEEIPLVLLEGDRRFTRFLREKALTAGIALDVAMECSTWTQLIDAMRECGLGGFLPKDLEKPFPPGFTMVVLPDLAEFPEDFVIARSAAESKERPEIVRLAKHLRGRQHQSPLKNRLQCAVCSSSARVMTAPRNAPALRGGRRR